MSVSVFRVVEDANRWLKQHPGLVVRNCETVELKVSTMEDYTKATSTKASVFKSKFRPTLYIKGLRVWYSSMIINKLPCSFGTTPCTLAYINVRPSQSSITDQGEYENFSAIVEKGNNLGRCGVYSGRILTAETVTIKEPEHEEASIMNMAADLDQTAWRDTFSKVALQFLRIYYLTEQSVREELCFKDFLPEYTKKNNKGQLKYKDFSSIMDNCRLWLLQHLDSTHRVLNAQTVETKSWSRTRPPDTKQTLHRDFENTARLRFLRVYYVKQDGEYSSESVAPLLMHRTFIPMTVRRRQHENMASLMQRVETWLRVTGATVVCAETVPLLEQVSRFAVRNCSILVYTRKVLFAGKSTFAFSFVHTLVEEDVQRKMPDVPFWENCNMFFGLGVLQSSKSSPDTFRSMPTCNNFACRDFRANITVNCGRNQTTPMVFARLGLQSRTRINSSKSEFSQHQANPLQ